MTDPSWLLLVAAFLALVGALATVDPTPDRVPEWYVEMCAEVTTC